MTPRSHRRHGPRRASGQLHSARIRRARKFADTAVPALLSRMLEMGAHKTSIVVRIAGSEDVHLISGLSSVLDVGSKNVEAVKAALKASRLRLTGEDCGGNYGRTFHLFLAEGRASVRTLGRSEIDL